MVVVVNKIEFLAGKTGRRKVYKVNNFFLSPSRLPGYLIFKTIRFCITAILVIFLSGCAQTEEKQPITITWQENKAVAIVVPRDLLKNAPVDSIEHWLLVSLKKNNNSVSILGSYTSSEKTIVFRPMIPFTRGLIYEVNFNKQLLSEVQIPLPDPAQAPSVLSIYPTRDTLPQNLLKFYIEFSKPMVAGEALRHITIIKNGHDTMPGVFLDLQPELWNNDGTILTLWLDPGRIKRDLQPNKEMGPPLEAASQYQLIIKDDWKDADGSSLKEDFNKNFFTGQRDDQSPDPLQWNFTQPKKDSKEPLVVDFHGSLDYVLLKNAIGITDKNGQAVAGVIQINRNETGISFIPSQPWQHGDYFFEAESRLEDNAGNNLNRLFDNDLLHEQPHFQKEIYRRPFHIN